MSVHAPSVSQSVATLTSRGWTRSRSPVSSPNPGQRRRARARCPSVRGGEPSPPPQTSTTSTSSTSSTFPPQPECLCPNSSASILYIFLVLGYFQENPQRLKCGESLVSEVFTTTASTVCVCVSADRSVYTQKVKKNLVTSLRVKVNFLFYC